MNLYLFFHLNLAFSSIEEEDRPQVIDSCYWPLLSLLEGKDIRAGIELSAYTLETIHRIAPDWVNKFRNLVATGKTEIIGSGYSQMIAPLAPAKVNHWNQKIGRTIYQQYGFSPQIALINEMAYSRGSLEHYIDAGYKGIIMEWNNPHLYHNDWQQKWRNFPQLVTDLQERTTPVIWADSIAFQKFQRYAHGEDELEDYLLFLQSKKRGEEQYFPLYSNDAEIFDYRPGRFTSEKKIAAESEWQRIALLFRALNNLPEYRFILPSQALVGLTAKDGGKHLFLESPEQPIPVKKQEKYNINRWAITGRGDYHINTACYDLYNSIKDSDDAALWQKLCYLWSSDFRTHITKKRWQQLTSVLHKTTVHRRRIKKQPLTSQTEPIKKEKRLTLHSEQLTLTVNAQKGLAIESFGLKEQPPLLGTIPHGFYDDISLGADFYSGHTIIETPAAHKATDLTTDTAYRNEEDAEKAVFSLCQNDHFRQEKQITLEKDALLLTKKIEVPRRTAARIYPFLFTFFPSAWDFSTLYFATHNGGYELEYFHFATAGEIRHNAMLSPLITAKHALGATEGLVVIGDADKSICFQHKPEECALIPRITIHKTNDGNFFCRLQYCAQEIDETFRPHNSPEHFICSLAIFINYTT